MEAGLRNKIIDGTRLNTEEGVSLFTDATTEELKELATLVRKRKSQEKVFFNRNFHVEPTNKCIYDCKFCSYSRALKDKSESWELSADEILNKVIKYDNEPVTEVHIVGGVHPDLGLEFFGEVLSRIRAHRPELHRKAFTAVEIHYMCKRAKVSYREGIKQLIESGLQSIPGGGAEIFSEDVRNEIVENLLADENLTEKERAETIQFEAENPMINIIKDIAESLLDGIVEFEETFAHLPSSCKAGVLYKPLRGSSGNLSFSSMAYIILEGIRNR